MKVFTLALLAVIPSTAPAAPPLTPPTVPGRATTIRFLATLCEKVTVYRSHAWGKRLVTNGG